MSEQPANQAPRRPDEHTRRLQARASDPHHSAWVSANAGSGKTFVLARRVVRLLLDGVAPGRILCLTFTKAAAAEMANRVFETLGRWVMLEPNELATELAELGGEALGAEKQRFARSLFAAALETPGGLKIQTIHAFCEALLQQFPLEANVPGHFSVADERRQQELISQARTEVFGAIASGNGKDELIAAANRLAVVSDKVIEAALDEILRNAEDFSTWYDDNRDGPLAEVWHRLGLDPNEDEAALAKRLHSAITVGEEELRQLADAAAASTSKNCELAARILLYLAASSPASHVRAFAGILLKPEGEEYKNLLTGALRQRFAGLDARLSELVPFAKKAMASLADWRLVKDSEALFAVAEAILARYGAAKRAAGLVDYADLIERAANLLMKNDVGAWVQYKLDQGIDHVLVDESQDTSPRQWQIIEALTGDFFSGQGARDTPAHDVCGRRRKAIDLFVPGRRAGAVFGAAQILCAIGFRRRRRAARDLAAVCRFARAPTFSPQSIRCLKRATTLSASARRRPGRRTMRCASTSPERFASGRCSACGTRPNRKTGSRPSTRLRRAIRRSSWRAGSRRRSTNGSSAAKYCPAWTGRCSHATSLS